jgi:hypothetical protein
MHQARGMGGTVGYSVLTLLHALIFDLLNSATDRLGLAIARKAP